MLFPFWYHGEEVQKDAGNDAEAAFKQMKGQ